MLAANRNEDFSTFVHNIDPDFIFFPSEAVTYDTGLNPV